MFYCCVEGRENFTRFWDALLGPSSDSEEAQQVVSPQGTAPVETRGSPGGQNLTLSDNLSSEEMKGASEPVSSDVAVSSEAIEVVGTVELPHAIPEAISDSQGVVELNAPAVTIKSLQSLSQKYCVHEGYIELDRISPGNNPRIIKECSVKIIKDSIENSGWDDYPVFIICIVTDDDALTNQCCFVFVNGLHRDLALKLLKQADFSKFS